MEFRHLRGFVAVAEELHFGKAAARLHIAQPALSQQIRALELDLGVRLFDRSTRSVELSDAGRAMLPAARRALDELAAARRAARLGLGEVVGRVRIGFAGASSQLALPKLTRAVSTRLPGVELVLTGQTYATAAAEDVAAGRLDLGFSRLPMPALGLAHHLYAHERLVAVLPTNHPLAEAGPIEMRELAEESFVTFPPETGSSVRNALVRAAAHAGFSPRIVQVAPDSYTILGLVDAGVGITVTVSSVLHIDSPTLMHRPVLGEPQHLDAVIAHRPSGNSRAVEAVLQVAREVLPSPLT